MRLGDSLFRLSCPRYLVAWFLLILALSLCRWASVAKSLAVRWQADFLLVELPQKGANLRPLAEPNTASVPVGGRVIQGVGYGN